MKIVIILVKLYYVTNNASDISARYFLLFFRIVFIFIAFLFHNNLKNSLSIELKLIDQLIIDPHLPFFFKIESNFS